MGKGTGKGKGKGGCCLDEAVDCVQGIAACICCLLCSGPILTAIGIYFITSSFSDDRGKSIDQYNMFVTDWQNGAVDGWNALPAGAFSYAVAGSAGCQVTVPPTAMQPVSTGDDFREEAGSKDFDTYTAARFVGDVSQLSAGTASTCSVTVTITYNNATVSTIQAPLSKTVVESFTDLGCSRSGSSSSSSSSKERDAYNRCAQVCQNQGGSVAGTSTSNFQCTTKAALAGVGIRVAKSGDGWAEASAVLPGRESSSNAASGKGIFRDSASWSQTNYQAGSAVTPEVTVRNQQDPYLYFLDISDGTGDFGLTTGEKLSIGFTCLIIGLLITLCVCGACCCVVRYARRDKSSPDARPHNPVAGALYDVSAKYSNYIPGGQAVGYPVAGPPPAGYPTTGQQGFSQPVPQPYSAPQQQYGQQPYGQQPYGQQPYDSQQFQQAPYATQPAAGYPVPPSGAAGYPPRI